MREVWESMQVQKCVSNCIMVFSLQMNCVSNANLGLVVVIIPLQQPRLPSRMTPDNWEHLCELLNSIDQGVSRVVQSHRMLNLDVLPLSCPVYPRKGRGSRTSSFHHRLPAIRIP